LALAGTAERKVDFQIYCGPSLGAFNQWVADSELSSWRQRHADGLALRLMSATADLLAETVARYA
jgi:trans-AT polyketide synthase/acyltransferase/oxidoreductase domain-containing protein